MNVFVSGTGITKFGELFDASLIDLALEASRDALKNAALESSDIDAVVVGNMLGSVLSHQGQLGAAISHGLGLHVDASRVEAACASGGIAVKRAVDMLLSGKYRHVLVVGAEKMSDHRSADVTQGLSYAADAEKEGFYGLTFPSLYGMMAQRYFYEYGGTNEKLASVSVKNHYHGARNPKAQFQKEITKDVVLKSALVASPLRLFDCSPISDGAAAVILSAEQISSHDIRIIASQVGSDSLALEDRDSLTQLTSTKVASAKAFEEAGVSREDIDIVELHDCFSIAEIFALEDMGFYEKGKALDASDAGETYAGKTLSVNTSGGLKACGHPVGATGVKQIVEVFEQLSGVADGRQVEDAQLGLTHNVGGSGATCVVHILKRFS